METIRLATEALIRLLKTEIDPDAVLVAADDVFEAVQVPALLVQGPTLTEDGRRRTLVHWTARDQAAMTFTGGASPRLYHLDFDLVVSTGTERTLLTLTGQVAALYQRHPVLVVEGLGALPLTELTPLGGMRRVNLSNLRQASGRLRLEDCPVSDDAGLHSESGRLVGTVRLDVTLTVAHNIVSHNGISANNTYDNIRLSMADRCLIQGNLCRRYMMGADLDQSKYGINIVVGQNNFVTGNHLYQAGVTDDLVDTGTSTYLHANVTSGGLEAP